MHKAIGFSSTDAQRAAAARMDASSVRYEVEEAVPVARKGSGVSCPFCRNAMTGFWFEHISKDDGKAYPIYRCQVCRSAFVYPSPTAEYLNEFYSSCAKYLTSESASEGLATALGWESKFPNATVDAGRIAGTLKGLGAGPRFLDVGAGCGFFSKAAVEHGFDVTAIELGERSRGVFKLMNSFDALDAAFDDGFCAKHTGSFDVVLLSQVLEHIPIESRPVENIRRVLSPNGICAIAVPHFRSSISLLQGKRDMFISAPEHLNFFTIRGLDALFRASGFKMIKHETVSRFDRAKLRSRIRPNLAADSISTLLNMFLKASDRFDKGMLIHAYFRKA